MSNKIESLLKKSEREESSSSHAGSSRACASRKFSTVSEAESNFLRFKEKLFHIERWNSNAGISSFKFYDHNGSRRPEKKAETGDFIEITLPGTGKADWVKISEIYEEPDEIIITVKPSENPTEKALNKRATSHFFTAEATNNFCLKRTDRKLSIYVVGLHEKTNTENTENILETIRNFATSNLGHYLGVQELEWETFCSSFLETDKSETGEKK